jgi:hypothetical protein
MTKNCSKISLVFFSTKVHYRVKDSPPLAGLLLLPFNCREFLLYSGNDSREIEGSEDLFLSLTSVFRLQASNPFVYEKMAKLYNNSFANSEAQFLASASVFTPS